MKKNKTLFIIAVALFPIVVISFAFKRGETNFNLDEFLGPVIPDNLPDMVDANFTVRVLVNGVTETMDLEDYIVGVVAGEMSASFEGEALKAQAVASRTYALYRKKSNADSQYDLTDNTNTQVYITLDAMKKKWGEDFQTYYDKVKEAVESTKGEVITYSGAIIEAFYFAMSSGHTQEASYVFSESRDYLKGVESLYDNNELKNYEVLTEISQEDFKSKLGLSCSSITVDNIVRNDYGYVEIITVCGKTFKGTSFRTTLGLRSTNLSIEIVDKVKVTTRGYGHGVGMSQYGANGYASHGYTYDEIIRHYYTGVEITKIKDV